MTSGISRVKIIYCLVFHILVVSSAEEDCLYKCKDFTGEEVCIIDDLLCNHFPDCLDGEDEDNCACKGFTCESNGWCLESSKKCDGYANCFDKSDEINCTKADYKARFPAFPEENLCKRPCGQQGSCSFESDDKAVCRCDDGYSGTFCEEENESPQAEKEPEETFACDRKEISMKLFCDGNFDCADKSDEVNCTITDYEKAKPHLDRRFLCLMPCQRTTCAFDHAFNAHCPCPQNAEGVFCEELVQTATQPPRTTSSTEQSLMLTSTRPDESAQEAAVESNNFFITIALPVIAVAGVALAIWLSIAKPWATGGTMGRLLV